MWIKTTEEKYINTNYLTEMYVTESDKQYWIAGYMPSGRKKTHAIEGPFSTKDGAVKRHKLLTYNINRKIGREAK